MGFLVSSPATVSPAAIPDPIRIDLVPCLMPTLQSQSSSELPPEKSSQPDLLAFGLRSSSFQSPPSALRLSGPAANPSFLSSLAARHSLPSQQRDHFPPQLHHPLQ